MEHIIEKLFDTNLFNDLEKCKTIHMVLNRLNKSWKEGLNPKEITKDDLLQMLGNQQDLENPELVDEILNLLVHAFQDPKTLSIVISKLGSRDGGRWATIIAGMYGKKARKAIPWIRHHLAGQALPDAAELALQHIGLSRKILYTGLRVAIRDGDPEGFLRLLDFMKFEYSDYQTDLEFKKILDSASRRKNLHIRHGALLTALSEMPSEIRVRFKDILERLASDQDTLVREVANDLLN